MAQVAPLPPHAADSSDALDAHPCAEPGAPTTGRTSAALSGSPALPLILRDVVAGCLAMALAWPIGHLFGITAA